MKKILLGTSAIVGVSMLFAGQALAGNGWPGAFGGAPAGSPKLKIDGYMRFEAWSDSQSKAAEQAQHNNSGFYTEIDDLRIHFRFDGVADNGLQYGGYARLEEGGGSYTSAGFQDTYTYLGGNWGRLILGDADPVQDTYKLNGSSIVADHEYAWDGQKPFQTLGNTARINDYFKGDSESNSISYYTPDFGGLTVGVTYIPNRASTMHATLLSETTTGNMVQDIGAGFDFVHSFNPVRLEVTGRYEHSKYAGNDTNDTSALENNNMWGLGAKVSYMGFDVVGNYSDNGNQNYYNTVTKALHDAGANGGWEADGGVRYTTGPYKVSVAYEHSEAKPGTSTSNPTNTPDKVDFLAVGANYTMAPGLDLYGEYEYVDLNRYGTSSDNTANLFMLGTQVSF